MLTTIASKTIIVPTTYVIVVVTSITTVHYFITLVKSDCFALKFIYYGRISWATYFTAVLHRMNSIVKEM